MLLKAFLGKLFKANDYHYYSTGSDLIYNSNLIREKRNFYEKM